MVNTFQQFFTRPENGEAPQYTRELEDLLDRAGIKSKPHEMLLAVAGGAALLWFAAALLIRPAFIVGILLLPLCAAAAAGATWMFIQFKLRKRLDNFIQQLELALRLIASGVRIGLGLRQALTMVIEEMHDPARYEYMRVVGQTNIGVSVYDALDFLSKRMPSHETMMMARAIRIQSQTGGDLGKLLTRVADTLRSRRTLIRKLRTLTAEGRISAWIILALPIFIGAFIVIVQPRMGHALLFTSIGQWSLVIAVGLELAALISLRKIMEFSP